MEENDRIPEWVDALGEQIAAGTEFKGIGHLEMRYSAPDENEWGVHLLALAPALLQVEDGDVGDGPNRDPGAPEIGASSVETDGGDESDGEIDYGVLHDCDLLTVQQSFDEVTSLSVGHEDDGGLRVTLGGKTGGNEVVILLYTTPFEDVPDDDDEEGDA